MRKNPNDIFGSISNGKIRAMNPKGRGKLPTDFKLYLPNFTEIF